MVQLNSTDRSLFVLDYKLDLIVISIVNNCLECWDLGAMRLQLTLFLGQDKRGFQQPSKDYIKFVRRQKRADEKRALKDFLYNDGPLRTFLHKDPIWSSNAEPPVGSRKRNEKAYARSAKKYHQDRTRSKLREESSAEDSESDNASYSVGSHSDRTILGLPLTGPLKIEDVKNAFRLSALKWHPDKHQGASQAAAGERFKLCVDAYKSLCDALA
ncbi:hypothetical protein OIU78_022653 [Salix suchowensis]|nr:hypothetical protein OIU78_022653 [Salix suchowensis]